MSTVRNTKTVSTKTTKAVATKTTTKKSAKKGMTIKEKVMRVVTKEGKVNARLLRKNLKITKDNFTGYKTAMRITSQLCTDGVLKRVAQGEYVLA